MKATGTRAIGGASAVGLTIAFALACVAYAASSRPEETIATTATPTIAARDAARPNSTGRHPRALSCIGPACDALAPSPLRAPVDEAAEPLLAEWHRFALNALLVPRLEIDGPLRWTAESLVTPCEGSARLEVDGRPVVAGDALPDRPFRMRWVLDRCAPLGPDAFELHGIVDMRIVVDGEEVRARVTTPRLVVSGQGRRVEGPEPFDATLSLGPSPRRE